MLKVKLKPDRTPRTIPLGRDRQNLITFEPGVIVKVEDIEKTRFESSEDFEIVEPKPKLDTKAEEKEKN